MPTEITTDSVDVVAADNVVVESGLTNVDVRTDKTKTAYVDPSNFVVTSGGMYSSDYPAGTVPEWLLGAIEQQLKTGDGNITDLVNDLSSLVGQLQEGVNQAITKVDTATESFNALETSVVSKLDNDLAAAYDAIVTKVDNESATAIELSVLRAEYNNSKSDIAKIQTSYVDSDQALASDISVISAEMNGISASIEDTREVVVGELKIWDGEGTAQLGMVYEFNGVWKKYMGSLIGWVHTTDMEAYQRVLAVEEDVDTFTDAVTGSLVDLQNQIDGSITTWFDDYTPSNANEPWLTWDAVDDDNGNNNEKDRHLGDIFYDTSTGSGYRFTYTTVYGWGVITDAAITKALSDASKAQDTADGKRTVFTTTGEFPQAQSINGTVVPIESGDLWIPSADYTSGGKTYLEGEVYRYVKGGNPLWVEATRYTEAILATDRLVNRRLFNGAWGDTPTLAGGTVAIPEVGDVWAVSDRWYNTAGTGVVTTRPATSIKNAVYGWNGSSWIIIPRDQIPANIVWAGAASSLLTGPNGEVTGWSYADGSGEQSTFAISADKFYIQDGSNAANVPFSIDATNGNKIKFSGVVEFGSVYSSDGTTLDEASFGNPVIYRQTTTPTGSLVKKDDLWQNGTTWKKYNGASWVTVSTPSDLTGYVENDAAAGVNASTTFIDGGKITAGTVQSNIFAGNKLVNLVWNGSSWIPATGADITMEIDLAGGSIYIK